MKKTLEEKTADAVFQEKRSVKVGGKTYITAPPSVRTMIHVSKYISQLPKFNLIDGENTVFQTLAYASNCKPLGKIIAMMIVGVRRWPLDFCSTVRRRILEGRILDLGPEKIFELYSELLKGMEVGFFYGIITSLNEVNLLREKMNQMTASGQ